MITRLLQPTLKRRKLRPYFQKCRMSNLFDKISQSLSQVSWVGMDVDAVSCCNQIILPPVQPICTIADICYRHHGQCKYVKDCEYTEPLCTPSSVPTWFLYRAGGVPGWLIEHGLQLSEKWDQKLLPGLAGSTRTAFGLPSEKSKWILYLFHFWNCSSLL